MIVGYSIRHYFEHDLKSSLDRTFFPILIENIAQEVTRNSLIEKSQNIMKMIVGHLTKKFKHFFYSNRFFYSNKISYILEYFNGDQMRNQFISKYSRYAINSIAFARLYFNVFNHL